jgi:hypothetical protein
MPQEMARALIDRTPTYEFRSAGKLCTAQLRDAHVRRYRISATEDP